MQLSLERQGKIAAVVVVLAGYIVTFSAAFSGSVFPFSTTEVVVGLLAGVVYLLLEMQNDQYFVRYPSPRGTAVFFTIQIALVFTVQWFLSGFLIWLIALPMVATAVERLSPYWRWPVYVTPIVGIIVPLWLKTHDSQLLLSISMSATTAVIFVIVFSKIRTNEQTAREKAEELTTELEKANRQLAAYAVQAEELATMAERNRLAREIHDNLGHYLTVVNVQLEAARTILDENPAKAREAMSKAQDLTQKGLTAVRQSVRALRESPLGNRPLTEALHNLADESQNAGIATHFTVTGQPCHLPANSELTLFRVTQEGLTNIRKHAQASQVSVNLTYQPHQVQLSIIDNGLGTDDPTPNGFGLIGIRERISQLGGDVKIGSAAGQGFTLTVTIPVITP